MLKKWKLILSIFLVMIMTIPINPFNVFTKKAHAETNKMGSISNYSYGIEQNNDMGLAQILQEYLDNNFETFFKNNDINTLYSEGIYFEPDKYELHPKPVDLSLRINNKFNSYIIEDIKIGDYIKSIISKLGSPQFEDSETGLMGYKKENYYIMFYGKTTLQEVSFIKIPKYEQYSNILNDFKTLLQDNSNNIFEYYKQKNEDYNGISNFLSYSGVNIFEYPFMGVKIITGDYENGDYFEVYSNYQGEKVYTDKVKYIDKDYIFNKEKKYFSLKANSDTSNKGYLDDTEKYESPNKVITAYYSELNFSSSSIYIKYKNDEKPVKKVQTGFCKDIKWISDRYLIISTMYDGIKLYDMNNLDEPIHLYTPSKEDKLNNSVHITSIDKNSISFNDELGNRKNIEYVLDNGIFKIDTSGKIKEFSIDLDGDKKNETIIVYYKENGLSTININGQSFNVKLDDALGKDSISVRAIDINKKDKYKEIEFVESMSSDYKHIVLLTYKNNKVIKLIEYGLNTACNGVNYDNLGNIYFNNINQILYTWDSKEKYNYNGTSINHIIIKYYKLNRATKIITPIKIQKAPNDSKAAFTLKKGEKVKIVLADGKGWFQLTNSNGKLGWFYCDPRTNKVQGKEQYKIFEKLPIAG